MNIAKKSTSKQGKILNGHASDDNTILIPEDNIFAKLTLNSGMNKQLPSDSTDDVIICNVELPKTNDKTPESSNGQLKRSSDSVDLTINKKLKTISTPGGHGLLAQTGPKMILLTSEHLSTLVKETLQEELIVQRKELTEHYAKENRELRVAMEQWRLTAQKLHNEIIQLRNRGKLGNESISSSHPKALPCNLPPASANPTTSQQLKMIHNSGLLNQSATNVNHTSQATGKVPTGSATVTIPSKHNSTSPHKQSGVIDLTSEDDSKTKTNQAAIPTILGELSVSNSNTATSTQVPKSNSNSKIPPPPLPPPAQPAPPYAKDLPPKPVVNLTNDDDGVHLTWDCESNPSSEEAVSYHLFSYQSQKEAPNRFLWKRVGNMVAMPLPMVCSLVKSKLDRQAAFAIRGVDRHFRFGQFSDIVVLNRELIT